MLITSHCFINAPFVHLRDHIEHYIDLGIQPEIGLEGDVLYDFSDDEFAKIAAKLHDAGLSCTLHAPFFELSVGALDRYIRDASRKKLRRAFQLIAVFKPKSIVCHLGFEENKHGYKEEEWFQHSIEAWREFLEIAENHHTPLMLENTYEKTPAQHQRILKTLNSPMARFCLDVGHVLAFAKNSWQDWLPALEPWLGQLHLHDNKGGKDLHLALGKGIFPFQELFDYLKAQELTPLITLEPHQENGVSDSLNALERFCFFR
ncbi:MAG: sugar phosphate isomerase/epimerase [Desulfobulbaceae bacterium]|nr:sugar phosphate isomerase/epimerase [Desulfobulbaceae bacterium]